MSKPAAVDTKTLADRIQAHAGALTIPYLAVLLSLDRGVLYKRAKAGTLPCFRIGTSVRCDPKIIADWLRDGGDR